MNTMCHIKYRKNENVDLKVKTKDYNCRKYIENVPNHFFGEHDKCSSYFYLKQSNILFSNPKLVS